MMRTDVYQDPSRPDVGYGVVHGRGVGRTPAYFAARIEEGSLSHKRIAPTELPPCETYQEAASALEAYARKKGWQFVGTMEVN